MSTDILIVKDEAGVVVAIQFLMEQQGYNVLVAERDEEALDVIYKCKPDLVLLDIMLLESVAGRFARLFDQIRIVATLELSF